MKLIVCTDDRGGMMFFGKRPARDRYAIDDIIKDAEGKQILIAPYSEKLFAEQGGKYTISTDPLADAGKDDAVFIEDRSAGAYLEKIDSIVIYSWDLSYPFDKKFDIAPEAEGFVKIQEKEFTGHAHKTVKKTLYTRKSK